MHCEPEPCSHGSAQPADACRGGLQRENALTASGLQVDGIEGFETEPQTSFCSCGGLCATRAGRPRTAGCGLGGVGLQGFGGRGSRGLASTSATPPATSTARRLREVRFVITDGRWSRGRNVPHCQRRAGGAGSLGGRPSNSSGDGRINRMRIRGAAEACRCAPLRGSA